MTRDERRVNVIAVDGDTVTIGVPDEHGGQRTLALSPPYVAPKFRPEAGDTALLSTSGPVPRLLPEVIAENAITARELDTITAGVFQTDDVNPRGIYDGAGLRFLDAAGDAVIEFDAATASALITGLYRSAKTGERFEIDAGEVRFFPDTGSEYGTIQAFTHDGFMGPRVRLWMTGVEMAGQYARVELSEGSASMFYGDTTITDLGGGLIQVVNNGPAFNVNSGHVGMSGPIAGDGIVVADLAMDFDHAVAVHVVSPIIELGQTAGAVKFKANATGVGFNNTPPIAAPVLPAAATTAGEALTLVNAIRQTLIDYGLAT